jgi:integrase
MIGDAVAVAKAHIADAEKDLTDKVLTLPAEFTFHDLRHYFASLLISSGADIKTVQARLRHESATTTLTTYSHLWPDADESTRSAVGAVISARAQFPADGLRTDKATT